MTTGSATRPNVSRQFLLAGHAICTLATSKHTWTFRITKVTGDAMHPGDRWFVGVLTGPNNTADYTYVGMLDPREGIVRVTKASRYPADAPMLIVLNGALRCVWVSAPLPEGWTLLHEGRCGRCGRLLTTPASIELGLGPECAGKSS